MKRIKKLGIGLVLVLVLVAATALVGFAKPQNYDSGFQVQNLSTDTNANITMTFYNRDGTVDLTVNDSVTMAGSNTYFPLNDDPGNSNGFPPGSGDVSDNFDGSVVISSNTEIAAIANLGADSLLFGASYNGFSQGSATSSLPLVMRGVGSFDTWVSIQNTGTSTVDITLDYSNGGSTTVTGVMPGAAAKFDQAGDTQIPVGFVGSAVASTSAGGAGSIAATAIMEGATNLFAYGGFAAGSILPIMPIYQANNFGYHSGVQIQNLGGSSTNVTMTFTGQTSGTTCTETRTVAAGTSVSFGLYVHHPTFVDPNPGSLISETCVQSETFIGAAAVTGNTTSQNLAAVVNQANFGLDKGSLYNGFDPASGTDTVLAPLVFDRNFTFQTGLTIVNAGGATIPVGGITCTYTASGGGFPNVVATNPDALDPGDPWLQLHSVGGSPFDVPLGNGFIGSATCVGPGGSSLVAVVNELSTSQALFPGDTLYTYEGTNQ